MALYSQTVTVGQTATLLYYHNEPNSATVTILNQDASVNLLIGGSDLTRSKYGHWIAKGNGEHDVMMNYGESLYGITETGTGTITVAVFGTGQQS